MGDIGHHLSPMQVSVLHDLDLADDAVCHLDENGSELVNFISAPDRELGRKARRLREIAPAEHLHV